MKLLLWCRYGGGFLIKVDCFEKSSGDVIYIERCKFKNWGRCAQNGRNRKMKNRKSAIALILTTAILLGGCSKPVEDKEKTNAAEITWEDNSAETENFKKLFLTAYPDVSIGEAFTGDYSVTEWQFRQEDEKKYLKCEYTYQDKSRILIFYCDEYENVNVAQYFVEGEKQDQAEIKKCCDELFKGKENSSSKEFSQSRIGYYSNGYWAMDIKSIDCQAKTIIYDGYEYAYSRTEAACKDQTGTIIDADTMECGGVSVPWDGDTFMLSGEYDAGFMGSGIGGNHDYEHGKGTYEKSNRPEEGKNETSADIFSGTPNYMVNYGGTGERDSYVFPESSNMKFHGYPNEGQTWLYQYGINEIYARHGYIFQNQDIQQLYAGKSWYVADEGFQDSMLTDIEKYNIEYLKKCIEETGGDGNSGIPSNEQSESFDGNAKEFFRQNEDFYTNDDTYQIVYIHANENSDDHDGILDVGKGERQAPVEGTAMETYFLDYAAEDTAVIIDEKKGYVSERGYIYFYNGEIYIDWDTGDLTGTYWQGRP